MPSLAHIAPGTTFGGDFRVVRLLAEGGMGAVYVVDQLSTGEKRALKVLQPQFVTDPRSRLRFDQEARAAGRIRSSHVVKVIQAGVDDATGIPWLCMELLEGEDLARVLARRGALAPAEVATIFEQACHALELAHHAGIVHRDLKPENLFLAAALSPGVPFTVKLLDFGIARFVDEARGTFGTTGAIGTPLWMSPEQVESGARATARSDVWALGLIAFQLLTGASYWRSGSANVASLIAELLTSDLPPASTRAAERGAAGALPPGFDAWFARCVARDPADRFAHAGDARDALLPVLRAAAPAAAAASIPAPLRPAPGGPPPKVTSGSLPYAPTAPLVARHAAPPVTRDGARDGGASAPPSPPAPAFAAPLPAPSAPPPHAPALPAPHLPSAPAPPPREPSAPPAPPRRRAAALLAVVGALAAACVLAASLRRIRDAADVRLARLERRTAAASERHDPSPPQHPEQPPPPVVSAPVTRGAWVRGHVNAAGAAPYALADASAAHASRGPEGARAQYHWPDGTLVSLIVAPPLVLGTRAVAPLYAPTYVYVALQDPAAPATIRGQTMRVERGAVTLTSVDDRPGGHVEGAFHGELEAPGSPGAAGTLHLEFRAEFPR